MESHERTKTMLGTVLMPYLLWYLLTAVLLLFVPASLSFQAAWLLIAFAALISLFVIEQRIIAREEGLGASVAVALSFFLGAAAGVWHWYAERVAMNQWYEGLNFQVIGVLVAALFFGSYGEFSRDLRRKLKSFFKP